ncbi:P-loop containing nucleoside triphosphate hydrolase protein [Coemansia spiralis]|nr:P-loop containing nucleoside triphosphate hydrolase protein [Coemansia spiralis]
MFVQDDRVLLCGSSEWAWSLYSDCFRSGFLWSAVLFLASGFSAAATTVCLVLPPSTSAITSDNGFVSDGSAPLACLSVGNKVKPVRHPLGAVVMFDNRLRADNDNRSNVGDDNSTPLAHLSSHKTSALVDSPEYGASWFDRLTFSWPNDMFHKGTTRQLGYSDLYCLRKKDAPLTTKTLRLRAKGFSKENADTKGIDISSNTDSNVCDSKIMNILTADFNRVTEVAAYLDDIFELPLTLGIGIWYMYKLLGVSALIGLSLGVATSTYVALERIDSYLGRPQVQNIENRVKANVNNALGFEIADLEWQNSNDNTEANGQNDFTLFNAETTSNAKSLNGNNQPAEETLAIFSCNASTLLSDNRDNNGSFSLNNIDVQFPAGRLSILAGPTGSDKSSLLSALIGEMTNSNSKYRDIIELSNKGLEIHNIAYVAQEGWLRNGTIRDNILFGEPYNKDRYEEVLRACALKLDLRILKAGDMTEISERGVTLSDGQKQRIALARAVYSSRRILLIDDCLSAVDAHTGKHVLMECLLSKTSLMQGRTCVLATHHVAMCLPFAQFLVMLHNGKIVLKGTPGELQAQGILTQALVELQKTNQTVDTDSMSDVDVDKETSVSGVYNGKSSSVAKDRKSEARGIMDLINDTKSEDNYTLERLQRIAEQEGIGPNYNTSTLQGELVGEEEREKGYVKFEIIDYDVIESIVSWFSGVTLLVTVFAIISSIIPMFIIVAIVITLAYAGVAFYYIKTSRELKRLESNSMSPLLSLFDELIQGISTIRAFDWMDAGLAGFVLSYSLSFSDSILSVVRDYSYNELNMNSVERLGYKLPTPWPTKGDIQIENLVAEYVPGVPVLNDISLSVKHSEKIGVIGRTGAGKSTLSLALLRFVEASGGRIVLDGVDISKTGLEDLRRSVTIIPQDPVLFNGAIRFNLDPFNEYSDEIVWDVLRCIHLVRENSGQSSSSTVGVNNGEHRNGSAYALPIERMSGIFSSLNAEIKESGQSLSHGQRQLVALARALVRKSQLIVMDEATASVDFDTNDKIHRTIRGYEFASSTLLCIAHRLRTIIDYDRVLVLDKGKVIEFDTPYRLLQNKDGIFRSMCKESGEYKHLAAAANRKRTSTSKTDNNTHSPM